MPRRFRYIPINEKPCFHSPLTLPFVCSADMVLTSDSAAMLKLSLLQRARTSVSGVLYTFRILILRSFFTYFSLTDPETLIPAAFNLSERTVPKNIAGFSMATSAPSAILHLPLRMSLLGVVLLLGKYNGYRLVELYRFRDLGNPEQ